MKERIKSVSKLLYLLIAIIIILMLFLNQPKDKTEETVAEEDTGSGFLEVETFPSDADIYVDGILKGKSPDILYSIPAGTHNIEIKKEGYVDYSMDVNVEAGKKAFVDADLAAEVEEPEVPGVEEIIEEAIKETKPIGAIEEEEEKIAEEPEGLEGENIINIGKKLQFYYDFSDGKFTDSGNTDSDVFSRRFDTYLIFTRFSPVNIKAINKKIENVNKEDCVGVKGTFEYLHSGRSLCIITKEGKIAAIGGYWENTENANLSWKVFD